VESKSEAVAIPQNLEAQGAKPAATHVERCQLLFQQASRMARIVESTPTDERELLLEYFFSSVRAFNILTPSKARDPRVEPQDSSQIVTSAPKVASPTSKKRKGGSRTPKTVSSKNTSPKAVHEHTIEEVKLVSALETAKAALRVASAEAGKQQLASGHPAVVNKVRALEALRLFRSQRDEKVIKPQPSSEEMDS